MFGHLNFTGGIPLLDSCRCSLCHELGAEFGLFSRWFTSYDLALVMLFALGSDETVASRKRLCPMLSRKEQLTGHRPLRRFLAAATMALLAEKVRDDERDEQLILSGRRRRWLEKRRRRAEATMRLHGFNPGLLTEAFARQRELEQQAGVSLAEAARATGEVMGALYAHAGRLAGRDSAAAELRTIGAAIGEIVYLLDSIRDYGEDVRWGRFNPLRGCGEAAPASGVPDASTAEVMALLESAGQRIAHAAKACAIPAELRTQVLSALQAEIAGLPEEKQASRCGAALSRFGEISPISIFFFPRQALAANGGGLGSALEPLIPFAIMLFILNAVLKKCVGRGLCGRERPDKFTVEDGCGGKKTYKRDPCSGKYKQDGC